MYHSRSIATKRLRCWTINHRSRRKRNACLRCRENWSICRFWVGGIEFGMLIMMGDRRLICTNKFIANGVNVVIVWQSETTIDINVQIESFFLFLIGLNTNSMKPSTFKYDTKINLKATSQPVRRDWLSLKKAIMQFSKPCPEIDGKIIRLFPKH